jgi:hypothetical protein
MSKFLVEAISQFRIVYVVDTETQSLAEDAVHLEKVEEFGQAHLGEMVVSSRLIDDDEAIRIHDELNSYLIEWTREQKLARVSKLKDVE